MKTIYTYIALITCIFLFTTACQSHKNKQNNTSKKDTLDLGYMYWANDTTPFGFSSRYSLILLGNVKEINLPTKIPEDIFYTPLEGVIEIQEVIVDSKLHNRDMTKIGYITSDCFEGTSLIPGDQVLVFSISYEGDYAITGRQSIIKIPTNDRRYITSLKKYITASYNPVSIEGDIELWNNVTDGETLKNYIREYKEYHQN